MIKTEQASGGQSVLARHGNRLGKPLLRQRVTLCHAILTAFEGGQTPAMQEGKRHWSGMTLADGTLVQFGTQRHLTVRARTPDGEVLSIDVECPSSRLDGINPISVVDIGICLNIAITALGAALAGNSVKAIKEHLRALTLTASREALDERLIADRIGIVLPSAFGRARVTLHSNHTAGIGRMRRTTAMAERLPDIVQISQDYAGGVTVERHPYQITKRRCKAAYQAGPLAKAA